MMMTKMTRVPLSLTWVGVALPPLSLSFRNISLLCWSLCWSAELLAAGCSILSMLARVISTNSPHHNTGIWNNACSWPTVGYSAFDDFRLLRLQTVVPRRRPESRGDDCCWLPVAFTQGCAQPNDPAGTTTLSGGWTKKKATRESYTHYREDPCSFVMELGNKLWKASIGSPPLFWSLNSIGYILSQNTSWSQCNFQTLCRSLPS